jgi:hypothetical protein
MADTEAERNACRVLLVEDDVPPKFHPAAS